MSVPKPVTRIIGRDIPADPMAELKPMQLPDIYGADHFLDPELAPNPENPDPALITIRNTYQGIRENAKNLLEARSERDPMTTPAKQVFSLQKAAKSFISRHAAAIDNAKMTAASAIKDIDEEVAERCNMKETAHASEIRRHLAGLKEDKRREVISKSIEKGDGSVLGAIFNAPAFLSGMENVNLEPLRDQFMHKHASDLLQRRQKIQKGASYLEKAANARYDFHDKFLPKEAVKLANMHAEQSRKLNDMMMG